MCPDRNASFSLSARRLMTAAPLDSEPVAGNVSTVPSGNADSMGAPLARMSHGSPLNGTAAATNFAPSSTEPPPTARIQSIRSARASATAFMSVS